MRKIISCLFVLIVSSCSSINAEHHMCPTIIIPRATTRSYQNEITDKFQINIVGHESYCFKNEADNRYYASIAPIFEVRRLEDSDTTNVDANFYVKTSVNELNYIGRRSFIQTLNIPEDVQELRITGRPSITRISNPPYKKFKIYLGMDLSNQRLAKAKQMFNINHRYLSEEDINNLNEKSYDTVSLELEEDEEIIYSKETGKPIVVKKNRSSDCCQN